MKIFFSTFIGVFLAELGDKTQLATLLFAANKNASKLFVFFGASLALIATSAIAVLIGGVLSTMVSERLLKLVAGSGFILIGLWTVISAR